MLAPTTITLLIEQITQPIRRVNSEIQQAQVRTELLRLSAYEGIEFIRSENEIILFALDAGQAGPVELSFVRSDLPQHIAKLQGGNDLFTKMKKNGITEISIPKDILFRPSSERFSHFVVPNSTDRKPSMGFSPDGIVITDWIVTKDKVSIDEILGAYEEIFDEIDKAARPAAANPRVKGTLGAAP